MDEKVVRGRSRATRTTDFQSVIFLQAVNLDSSWQDATAAVAIVAGKLIAGM